MTEESLAEFSRIRQATKTLAYADMVTYILELGPDSVKQWTSEQGESEVLGEVQVVYTHDSYRRCVHSSERPAWINRKGEPVYVLFGRVLDQAEWFRILGFTPEEQTLHCLQWGR